MNSLTSSAWAIGALSLLSACIVPESPVETRDANTAVPESYGDAKDEANSAELTWDEFFDPQLSQLIDIALQNNQELNIAALEIGIANNEVMARRGEYLPRVDFKAGAGLEKVGEDTSQGRADEANGVPEHLQDYVFGFFASWEIDIW